MAPFSVGDGVVGQQYGRLADQHLAGLGRCLEPSRRIHDRPGHEKLPGRTEPRGGLARIYPDPNFQGLEEPERIAHAAEAPAEREPGSHGTERVVLVHGGQPEDRHHRVADELLRPATEGLQLLSGGIEELADHLSRALRIQTPGEAGGVDQVGEQDRDHLPFFGPERGGDHRAAIRAESCLLGDRRAADRTRHPSSIGGDNDTFGPRSPSPP